MRSKKGLGLALGLMLAGISSLQPRAHAAEVEAINGNLLPPFLVWGTDQAGWIFRPSRDLLVDGVFSTFRNVGAASQTGPVLRRDVTVQLRRGNAQGELLAQGVFSADATAGALGARFEPVLLLAGQAYFISYRGLNNLGLNIVDWNITAPAPQQPAGTVNLDGWYSGANFETYVPRVVNGTLQVFSAPILRFEGAAVTQLPAVDCLFQWAEVQVPAVLARAGAATGAFQSWYYRYYPATQVYLGVAMGSGRVAYLSNGSLTELGALGDWLATSGCNAAR
jgi:hypothetical protein